MTFRQKSLQTQPLSIAVTRGNFTESVHLVDAAVVDDHGRWIQVYGDVDKVLASPRSAIKMLQAVSLVESGAMEKFDLSSRHLALACASHSGESFHTELAEQWLKKIGVLESDLVCGAHWPYHEKTMHEMIARREQPCRLHNNCSGKHAGFLSTIQQLGGDIKNYESYDHPLQLRLRQILSEVTKISWDQAPWGIDGCGIPTYAVPLVSVAQALRFLFTPSSSKERTTAFQRIREAVIAHPELIAGTESFCSVIIRESQGRALVKTGAEGYYAGAIPEKGLAFSLKVRDGHPRASRVATAWILKQFGGLSEVEFLRLSRHTEPSVTNWAGKTVGKIFVPLAELQ